jgi:hypothetical protein
MERAFVISFWTSAAKDVQIAGGSLAASFRSAFQSSSAALTVCELRQVPSQ